MSFLTRLATMTVLAFPPSESCSSLVSLESRYGTWELFPSTWGRGMKREMLAAGYWLHEHMADWLTRAAITFPRAERERLILVASLKRSP